MFDRWCAPHESTSLRLEQERLEGFLAMAGDAASLLAEKEGMERALRASMRVLQARGSFWPGDAAGQQLHASEAMSLAESESKQRFDAAAELASACSTLGELDNLLQLVDEFTRPDVASEVLPDYLVGCCRLGIALQRAGWPEHVERILGKIRDELLSNTGSHRRCARGRGCSTRSSRITREITRTASR